MISTHFQKFVDLALKDKKGKWAVAQFPNLPITLWALLTVLLLFIHHSHLATSLRLLQHAVLFTWAYLEITSGASYFRRLLGAVVILVIVVSYFS